MNTTHIPPRKDALLDAYRQASEHEGGRPGAQVRGAVLAHARVVAQSRPSAMLGSSASAVSQAMRDAPAANDRAPLWRLAAGVVIGLVGVWIFQLTRPAATPETSSASVSGTVTAPAPQVAPTNTETPVAAKLATVTQSEASVAAATPAPVLAQATAASRASNQTRTQSVVASLPPNAPDNNVASRGGAADQARPENSMALSKTPAPAAAPAPDAAAGSAADAATSEVMIASVETRKSARAPAPASIPLPSPPPSSPAAFPAVTPEAAIAAAPSRRSETSGRSGWTGWNSEADQALFKALNADDLPRLRAAITRGANVNARDERGRTALQVARERADAEAVRALEAAGAR